MPGHCGVLFPPSFDPALQVDVLGQRFKVSEERFPVGFLFELLIKCVVSELHFPCWTQSSRMSDSEGPLQISSPALLFYR